MGPGFDTGKLTRPQTPMGALAYYYVELRDNQYTGYLMQAYTPKML